MSYHSVFSSQLTKRFTLSPLCYYVSYLSQISESTNLLVRALNISVGPSAISGLRGSSECGLPGLQGVVTQRKIMFIPLLLPPQKNTRLSYSHCLRTWCLKSR
jgi:hypothetical protein